MRRRSANEGSSVPQAMSSGEEVRSDWKQGLYSVNASAPRASTSSRGASRRPVGSHNSSEPIERSYSHCSRDGYTP